ncbi:MAG: LapA family protein [Alphaproteobacteria bacterium]|nr:LapA family protein [Alphaproteobacteria bacterium]
MKYISWLITLPILLLTASFVFSNRQDIELSLWPFDGSIVVPSYLIILCTLLAGIIFGAVFTLIGTMRYRIEASRLRKELIKKGNDNNE